MNIEQQREDYKKMTTDVARWKWIFDVNKGQLERNEEQTLRLHLDNDQTYLSIGGGDWYKFDYSIGWMGGVADLFDALRIDSECV